jgi:hypothetical protein
LSLDRIRNKDMKQTVDPESEEARQILLTTPCTCGVIPTLVYKIDSGAYKGIWVAACEKPRCDIEYYFGEVGQEKRMKVIS